MDRFRQKTKKEKPTKHVDKEKSPSFITDVKSIKENLKIKEILMTVKMNSSMRVKAPRGSKVMSNKDFNDNEDSFEGANTDVHEQDLPEPASATNPDVILAHKENEAVVAENDNNNDYINNLSIENEEPSNRIELMDDGVMLRNQFHKAEDDNYNHENIFNNLVIPDSISIDRSSHLISGERKLSLDQTLLTRRECLSQSELELNSIGKPPLQRKSSFFRKKMDSFLKNTTEIFKRQSMNSKSQHIHRRGSKSVSLQSLTDKTSNFCNPALQSQGNASSLQSSSTDCSECSPSTSQILAISEQGSPAGSQPMLCSSQPLADSVNSLNEGYIQESRLSSRAISMSSGLDSAKGQLRRKASRSNRRVIQDENGHDIQVYHSYSDFSSIPENGLSAPKLHSKGRRLSYQRAVSGEDPVMPLRYQESTSRRRPHIPEHSEADYELSNLLAEFTKNGLPELKGFSIQDIPENVTAVLLWAEEPTNLENIYDWKKLSSMDEARQAVIRELVTTEAKYIRHLICIVEVFITAAHALQDRGKMLDVDTARLFSNIPDVLLASLAFWEATFFPMITDAMAKKSPFNTEHMALGFSAFRDILLPYERFLTDQSKAVDYLRSLSNNSDFMMYLSWCHAHSSCDRLNLSDIMVKPLQRLTKYDMILHRLIGYTDTQPERTSLMAMESYARNYVVDLNRSIRQRDELEKLDHLCTIIDGYEMEFKDEELDKCFRMYSQINLKAPMVNCSPGHSRSLIFEGDLRYKDHMKETDCRAFLLTDMLLICKKLSKNNSFTYKMLRPKFMLDKMVPFPKITRSAKDGLMLIFVVLDEVGSSCYGFALSESSKDTNPQATLKMWELKVKEAKMTYDLAVWFSKNPSHDISEVEIDSSSEYAISAPGAGGKTTTVAKLSSDEVNIEREARERVAAMLHRGMGASTEHDYSQVSMNTDSFDGEPSAGAGGARTPGPHGLRHPMHRNSTGGSSRNSRLSSFQKSTSAASHDEPQPGPSRYNYRAGSSVEHHIPPLNPEDTGTSITVNVVSESDCETVLLQQPATQSPKKQGQGGRNSSGRHNTLRVESPGGAQALVHSLPDLTLEPSPPRPTRSASAMSASEKLYQSHQELLYRNRLLAAHHHQFLSADHRGTSYPPPSPTRAYLQRSMAFSYSLKNPPLSKMGHVNSQSQIQADAAMIQQMERDVAIPTPVPGISADKSEKSDKHEKKSKLFSTRNKGRDAARPEAGPITEAGQSAKPLTPRPGPNTEAGPSARPLSPRPGPSTEAGPNTRPLSPRPGPSTEAGPSFEAMPSSEFRPSSRPDTGLSPGAKSSSTRKIFE